MKAAAPQNAKPGLHLRIAPPLARAIRREVWIRGLLAAALISSLSVLVIFGFLLYFTAPLFQGGKLGEVLSWQWRPFQGQFGILPMVVGSVCLAGSALVLAFPLGLGLSGFVYLQGRKPIGRLVLWVVQGMTSIPTVVYGFVSVFLLIPFLRGSFAGPPDFPGWLPLSFSVC